jgi:membrane-associated phospholipid phosphatase
MKCLEFGLSFFLVASRLGSSANQEEAPCTPGRQQVSTGPDVALGATKPELRSNSAVRIGHPTQEGHAYMSVFFHGISSVDIAVYQFLNGYAGQWLLDRFAAFEEDNNLFKGGLFFAAYTYLWFRIGPEQEKVRRAIIAILTGTLLALVVTRTIADIAPYRVRPIYDSRISHQPYSLPISPNMENWSSFPSDTAAYFFALSCGLAYLMRRYTIPIMLYTAGWICLPRVFLGVHYPSDIGVGGAIGMMTIWASLRSEWLRSGIATHAFAFMDEKPQLFYASAFIVCFEMSVLFDDVRAIGRGVFHIRLVMLHRGPFLFVLAAGVFLVVIAAFVVIRTRYPPNRRA